MSNEIQQPASDEVARLAAQVREMEARLRRVELKVGLSPKTEQEWLASLRRPQDEHSGINAILGQWPGEETEAEIGEWLEKLS
jgi:hypothetical protein